MVKWCRVRTAGFRGGAAAAAVATLALVKKGNGRPAGEQNIRYAAEVAIASGANSQPGREAAHNECSA